MRPSTTTLLILPALTSSTNCEYGIGCCELERVLNWLKTVISTRPMTSQITRFLTRLFKSTPSERARLLRADAPDSTPKPKGLRQETCRKTPTPATALYAARARADTSRSSGSATRPACATRPARSKPACAAGAPESQRLGTP